MKKSPPQPAATQPAPKAREKLSIALRGFLMGAADVVPGVSGGTIAYVTGLYPRLVRALATFGVHWFADLLSFDSSRIKRALGAVPYGFILPLLVGIVSAIVVFVWGLSLGALVEAHPLPFYGLFFGFVGVSALFLLGRYGSTCPRLLLFVFAGFVLAYEGGAAVPVQTPETSWFVFLSGMLAISAMVLPGVSGALILLILGQYSHILTSLEALDLNIILPFVAGLGVGLLLFGQLLNWLMAHFYRKTMLVMVGLLFGSLRALWPFTDIPPTPTHITTFTLLAALGGAIIVVLYLWEGLLKSFPQRNNQSS